MLNLVESLLTTIADCLPLEISFAYLAHHDKLKSARSGLLLIQENQSTTLVNSLIFSLCDLGACKRKSETASPARIELIHLDDVSNTWHFTSTSSTKDIVLKYAILSVVMIAILWIVLDPRELGYKRKTPLERTHKSCINFNRNFLILVKRSCALGFRQRLQKKVCWLNHFM